MAIMKGACMRRLAERGFTRQAISIAISYTYRRGSSLSAPKSKSGERYVARTSGKEYIYLKEEQKVGYITKEKRRKNFGDYTVDF